MRSGLLGDRFGNERWGDGSWTPGESLIDYLDGNIGNEISYARYWHGYLVVLKPLLFLTNLNTIHLLAGSIQILLLGICLIALCKQKLYAVAGGMTVAMPFLYFFALYKSLSLSICYYLMIVGMLGVLYLWKKEVSHKWFAIFFLLMGAVTSYFDFLTYPLVTLGFPLCLYLVLSRANATQLFVKLIKCSFEWFVGYAGMWSMKWILPLGFIVLYFLFKKFELLKKNWKCTLIIVLVALYPFVWYFVTANHSFEHWMFTNKELSIAIFAIACGIEKLQENT